MESFTRGAFAKGVQQAGDAKWSAAAQGKGAERFGPGAQAGVGDYEKGVQKYLNVIENTILPPRGPKGDPRNIERVKVMASALRKAKTGFALVPLLLLASLLIMAVVGVFALKQPGALRPQTPGTYAEEPINQKTARPGGVGVTLVAILAGAIGACCCMAAIDTVTFSVTAAAAGGTAMAAVAGDSAAVRNVPFGNLPVMLTHFLKTQTAGFYQWTHPSGHDVQRDFRGRHNSATVLPMQAPGWAEPLEPQEAISATLGAGAVAGDIELLTFLMYYPELPGTLARLIDLAELDSRFVEYVTVEDTTTATVGATYSGARALNAGSDLLVANTDFAVLGAHIGGICGALTVRGVDTGNLRCPIPGMPGRSDLTARWFPFLCEEFGLPLIPIFNSANKAGIFIENITDENLVAVPFALVLARLSMS